MNPSLHRYYRLFPPPPLLPTRVMLRTPPDRPCTCHFTRFYGFVRIIVEEMRQKLQRIREEKKYNRERGKKGCAYLDTPSCSYLSLMEKL